MTTRLCYNETPGLFTRVSRPKYPICTKPYAFDAFPQRLRITRTYAPHEVSPEYLKPRGKSAAIVPFDKSKNTTTKDVKKKSLPAASTSESSKAASASLTPAQRRERQKERVNNIARALLARLGSRAPLDASYLLRAAPRRPRPRPRPRHAS
ncbi:histone-lysine N-methyltransferase ASH1L-like [Ostrinia nubilalis]|uniref:histone-lysine N-methyltransferase ASH1L-like n=1 Tax=Ostrinia nubilalis TaxID=29057 RepID=UPI00308222A2